MDREVTFVLVEPQYGYNIGASYRAIKNMGYDRLILVNHHGSYDRRTREGAAGLAEELCQLKHYSDLESFFKEEGAGIRIGFTRREGRRRKIFSFERVLREHTEDWSGRPIYLFFGNERSGLSADDLEMMNYRCSLPTPGEFKSLNLSQAVLLAAYLLQRDFFQKSIQDIESRDEKDIKALNFPREVLKDVLREMGYEITKDRKTIYAVLTEMILRGTPTDYELEIFHSVLQKTKRLLSQSKDDFIEK